MLSSLSDQCGDTLPSFISLVRFYPLTNVLCSQFKSKSQIPQWFLSEEERNVLWLSQTFNDDLDNTMVFQIVVFYPTLTVCACPFRISTWASIHYVSFIEKLIFSVCQNCRRTDYYSFCELIRYIFSYSCSYSFKNTFWEWDNSRFHNS